VPISNTATGNMFSLIQIATTDLVSFLDKQLPTLSPDWWRRNVIDRLTYQQQQVAEVRGFTKLEQLDFAALLRVLDKNWYELGQNLSLSRDGLNYIKELQSFRNKWAHLSLRKVEAEEIYRDADTMSRALKELDAPQSSIDAIEKIKLNALSKMVPAHKVTNSIQQDKAETARTETKSILNHHPLASGLQRMHICDQLVISARYLEAHGLTQPQLTSMHHFSLQGGTECFSTTYEYFGSRKNLQTRNRNYANRLIFVATEHQKTKGDFNELILQALDKWPLV